MPSLFHNGRTRTKGHYKTKGHYLYPSAYKSQPRTGHTRHRRKQHEAQDHRTENCTKRGTPTARPCADDAGPAFRFHPWKGRDFAFEGVGSLPVCCVGAAAHVSPPSPGGRPKLTSRGGGGVGWAMGVSRAVEGGWAHCQSVHRRVSAASSLPGCVGGPRGRAAGTGPEQLRLPRLPCVR